VNALAIATYLVAVSALLAAIIRQVRRADVSERERLRRDADRAREARRQREYSEFGTLIHHEHHEHGVDVYDDIGMP
jgi:hypothetical protein